MGTTTIDLSIPIAGSVPKWPTNTSTLLPSLPESFFVPDLPEGRDPRAVSPNIFVPPPQPGAGGDYEQEQSRPMYSSVGGFIQMYILAGFQNHQLQILHEYDSCCFRAAGLADSIITYNKFVQGHCARGGWMQTAVTSGNYHEVNLRDKVLIALLVEKL